MFETAREQVSLLSDTYGIITLFATVWGFISSYILWKTSFRRYKFSKVFFPRSRQEFYEYYVSVVSKARKSVALTSDGFNMCNGRSASAARQMNLAQQEAIARGATVCRYQMTRTMHLNWLLEIARMKHVHGEKYRTYINRNFEDIGSFAVIDPGTRRAVVEFMLPDVGSLTQATTARDFGFIHGHQAKASEAQDVFRRILEHPDTIEVTPENWEKIASELFQFRYERHRKEENYHMFDEEVLIAMKRAGRRNITFDDVELGILDFSEMTAEKAPASTNNVAQEPDPAISV